MATITMRKNKKGQRSFVIRVKMAGEVFCSRYPGKLDDPIPDTWSNKKATKEAEKAAALFESECKRGLISNNKTSLADYISYVIDLKEKNGHIKPLTAEGYKRLFKRIKAAKMAKKRLTDIRVSDLNNFYNELSEEGQNQNTGKKLSAKTIREYHNLISSCLTQAAREGIIQSNPAAFATLPKIERKEANFIEPDTITRILDVIQNEPLHWQAITYILIGTGARRAEVAGLRWSDINFKDHTIKIQRNIVRAKGKLIEGTPKTGDFRTITAPAEVIKILMTWKQEQAARLKSLSMNGYCFALLDHQTPIDPCSITAYYYKLADRYGLSRINPHAFRHTQASVLMRSGDIAAASKRLGHSRTSTTIDIYGHMLPKTDKELSDKISAELFNHK